MAQWKLNFRVDVRRGIRANTIYQPIGPDRTRHGVEPERQEILDATSILRGVSRVDPRPIRTKYEHGVVEVSFVVDAESVSEAGRQQSRIHDSLSTAIDGTGLDMMYAIEFDPPQGVNAGANAR